MLSGKFFFLCFQRFVEEMKVLFLFLDKYTSILSYPMDFRAISERIFNSFALNDDEISDEKREVLNLYLNRLTDHVNVANGSPLKQSSKIVQSGNVA